MPTFATDLKKLALVNIFLGYILPDVKAKILRRSSDVNTPLSNFCYVILWNESGLFWCTTSYIPC